MIMLEFQDTKTFLLKDTLKIGQIKDIAQWTYVISDLNGEKIAWSFYEKELQKADQKEYRTKKVIKKRR